jgi:L-2,4-diaminobutyric acid acetyltransferase
MKAQDETPARPFALSTDILIRTPAASDGAAVNELIERCKPLDENSVYCNLLQCSHFNDTCVLAEAEGEVVGFVSGYLLPKRDDRLFVWQVAVDERARGRSLAQTMVLDLLRRPACRHVTGLQTTITPNNKPSQALFSSLAETLEADVDKRILFHEERHFGGDQPSEVLWEIGPFDPAEALDAILPRPGISLQSAA